MAMARAEGTISSKIAKVWMSGQCSPVVNVLRELQLLVLVKFLSALPLPREVRASDDAYWPTPSTSLHINPVEFTHRLMRPFADNAFFGFP